jgi:hypothetical protein
MILGPSPLLNTEANLPHILPVELHGKVTLYPSHVAGIHSKFQVGYSCNSDQKMRSEAALKLLYCLWRIMLNPIPYPSLRTATTSEISTNAPYPTQQEPVKIFDHG